MAKAVRPEGNLIRAASTINAGDEAQATSLAFSSVYFQVSSFRCGRDWESVTSWELRRSEEHTSELQSRENLVCRLLLEKSTSPRHLHSFPTRRSSDLRIGRHGQGCAAGGQFDTGGINNKCRR